jgi:hypothetical protein
MVHMWVLFFVIGSALAGSSVTTVAGFKNNEDCESARAQVERKLRPARSACIEMTQGIIGLPAPDAPVDHDH